MPWLDRQPADHSGTREWSGRQHHLASGAGASCAVCGASPALSAVLTFHGHIRIRLKGLRSHTDPGTPSSLMRPEGETQVGCSGLPWLCGLFRFAAGRTPATSLLKSVRSFCLSRFAERSSRCLLQPCWRPPSPSPSAPRETFQRQNCFFDLLALEAQFREHFINVQNTCLLLSSLFK